MVNFCAKSVLGAGYPHLVRPRGRRLKCCVERTAIRYTRKLRQLTCEHGMYEKMDALISSPDDTRREQTAYRLNKWDGEHTEHQACFGKQLQYLQGWLNRLQPGGGRVDQAQRYL